MRPYILYFVILIFFCTLGASSHAAECATGMTDNGNGTVTDSNTELTWKQCLDGQTAVSGSPPSCTGDPTTYTWTAALGKDDGTWRVPNIKELQSIVDYTTTEPAVTTACLPNTLGTADIFVWSSSPVASDTAKSWVVNFKNGSFLNIIPQTSIINGNQVDVYVRLVCDGNSAACQP